MTYAAYLDEEFIEEIATNRGLGDFYRWIETLPADKYDQLASLRESGYSEALDTLEAQLRQAMQEHTPDPDTLTVAQRLLDVLQERTKDTAVLIISNGIVYD